MSIVFYISRAKQMFFMTSIRMVQISKSKKARPFCKRNKKCESSKSNKLLALWCTDDMSNLFDIQSRTGHFI